MRRAIFILGLIVTGSAGCSDNGPPTIRVVIDADDEARLEIDKIKFLATASRIVGEDLCRPFNWTYQIPSQTNFPIIIDMFQGEEYGVLVVFNVEVMRGSRRAFLRQGRLAWPEIGTTIERVWLTSNCLVSTCGDDEQCIDGECVLVSMPDVFNMEDQWDGVPPCDLFAQDETEE